MNVDRDKPIVDLEQLIVTINKGIKSGLISTTKGEKMVELNDAFLEAIELDLIHLYKLKDKLNIKFAEA